MPCTHTLRILARSAFGAAALLSTTLTQAQEANGPVSARVDLALLGGQATDALGVRSGSVTLAPTLVLSGGASWLTLGGSHTRFGEQGHATGGSLAVGSRAPLVAVGPVSFLAALDAGAAITRTSFDAAFRGAEATPALELGVGRFAVFGGTRAAIASTSLPVPSRTGGGLPVLGGSRETVRQETTNRSVVAPVYGGAIRGIPLGSVALLDAGYREERGEYDDVRVLDRSLSLALRAGALTVGLAGGGRSARDEESTFGSASLGVALAEAVSFDVAVGKYPTNRLNNQAGGRYATAGLTFRVGGPRPAPAAVAEPARVAAPAAGTTRLSLRAPDARRVELAGSWNDWRPVPATRAANGVWYVDVALAPGEYRYAFKVDGRDWRVPEGAVVHDDDFGGRSAWLTVSGPRSGARR